MDGDVAPGAGDHRSNRDVWLLGLVEGPDPESEHGLVADAQGCAGLFPLDCRGRRRELDTVGDDRALGAQARIHCSDLVELGLRHADHAVCGADDRAQIGACRGRQRACDTANEVQPVQRQHRWVPRERGEGERARNLAVYVHEVVVRCSSIDTYDAADDARS